MINLRSLLIAAFMLSNVAWTTSRHHFRHNVNGHRSRHRRQDAGLFHPASYVIPGGEGTGAWGEWGKVSPCSRTCGGGVANQKRICLEVGPDGQPLCTGGDTKYFSCQTQDCPENSGDFRAEQCSEYDHQAFRGSGITYNWVPYTKAPNPCELNCMPRGERFYYRQKAQVVDGTRCNDESFDVCVGGVCQPVGCDMMLGSNAREDKCRNCRGNGTNCYTVAGLLDTDDLRKGYNDMLLIPQGATNVFIEEVRESNNYLALRAKQNNVYYLNGDYHIDFPRSLIIAGTLWHYDRSQQGLAAPDKLRCLGPTIEPLYLSLLLQDHNVGISYEYSMPSALAPPPNQQYNWVHESFSECSTTCGGGFQTREVTCRSREELNIVDDMLCDEGLKPTTNQTCNIEACPPRWVEGPWSPCSKPCGDGGTRSRQVYCEKIITNRETFRFPSIVADKDCFDLLGPKPELYQPCNQNATCPTWFTGPWKPCNRLCGEGTQTRQVVCHQRTKGFVQLFEDRECETEKPATEKTCLLHPCDGVDWVISDWSGCDTCLSTVRTRVAHCATKDHKIIDSELCSYHPKPVLKEPCDRTKLPSCQVQWYATQWSNCSVECGTGVRTRRVFCGLFDGASVIKVGDERCDEKNKYNDTVECVIPQEKCPAKWFAGPWSECTKECGGGEQYRRVMCLSGGKEVLQCDEDTVLDSTQSCNSGSCDKDDLLPIDSKTTPVLDDNDEEYCVEEEEEYPEAGAEAYTPPSYYSTLVPDFIPPEELSTETGSGFEWIDSTTEFYDTSTTEVTGSTESTVTSSTDEGSSTELEVTEIISTESSTTDNINSISTESSETTTDSSSSSITEDTDSTTETDELSTTDSGSITSESEFSTTENIDSSTIISTDTSATDSDISSTTDTLLSSTTEDSKSTITESETSTTETIDGDISSTTETSLSSTTDNGETTITGIELSTTESTDSSTIVSTLSSIEESSDFSTTSNTESSTTDNVASSTTENVETSTTDSSMSSTTVSDQTSTSESALSSTTEISESSTTEKDATSTIENISSSTTENDETSTTESVESSTTESSSSSTTESVESSTTESSSSSTSESSLSSTTESSSSSTTESVESSTTESSSSSTTESSLSSTTESSLSSTTESSLSSTNGESSTTETTVFVTTESAASSTTESDISSTTESVVSSTTESTESSTTASDLSSTTETALSSTTESGSSTTTESFETSDTSSTGGSTDSTTSESSTDYSTESSTTGSAETGTTGFTETETIESSTTSAGSTDASISTQESTTDESSVTKTTPWDWKATVEVFTEKPHCKPRKSRKCNKSKFGCCPDKKTPAAGPFDEGCPNPETCKDLKFGCCPDGVSPAAGPLGRGCPIPPCNETLYGCCSDNVTAAEGNNQEGCPPLPPACKSSKYDCCDDNKTEAKGPEKQGCPEMEINTEKITTVDEGCATSEFGCCFDNETDAAGPNGEGCPCSISEFGCCPDGVATAGGSNMEGCLMSCNTSAYGCCPDGETPAHGPQHEGCCLQNVFGCCPDNYRPAEGPHLEGCECQNARFGCCTDNVTVARGPNMEGCGCEHSQHGCCPDRHTEAQGPEFQGCGCHTYQFGCCLDGVTIAAGPELEGCRCERSKYGCCGDETTSAKGPNMEGCDCSNSKYGCCPDGETEAKGDKFQNCSDVPVNRQAACALDNDKGTCRNYTVNWFYDMQYGGCSQFWYGGCEGNGNRFATKEECEDVCVQPSPKDACNLPKVKATCEGYHVRWYYDSEREQCSQFVYGGCLGNANNFDTKELCQERCEPEKTEDQCNLPLERGPCAGNFARWGFSAERRRCEQFVWGGCGGNRNRYHSEAACLLRCAPPGEPRQACSLPQDAGNCTEKHPLWSFSQTENRCVPFYYSGCGGNDNRFNTEQSCDDSCPSAYVQEICTLPAMIGDCADYTQRWFFDTSRKRCRLFYYGGCGGNENNFLSESECENRCSEQSTTTTASPQPLQPQTEPTVPREPSEFCLLDIDKGPCTQSLTRWAHDSASGACVEFQYGGCGGNRNNFPNLEYCQHYCGSTPQQDVCQLPFVSGPCDQSIMQWFYDAASDSCNLFTYGGCEGNGNRFNSLADCERQCRAQTLPPATTTPATTAKAAETIPRECEVSREMEECVESGEVWFLDVEQRDCVSFHNEASGPRCRHTGVFTSQEACERTCGAFRGLDVCRYSLDPGPCREDVPKVYFETATGRCEPFTYGGCHGGPNRFSTVEECEQICRPNADPCGQTPEPGNCLAYFVMWYYDSERNRCDQFVYGGCNGNDNRFETQAECEGRCKKETTTVFVPTAAPFTTTTTTTIAPSPTPEFIAEAECATPVSLAPCGQNVTVYYFDTRTQACLVGDFGACRYSNSYRTEEECQRRCGAFRGLDVCGSRLDPGPCLDTIPKFYWDPLSGRCLGFAYGGCHGGPNRFSTEDECEEICGSTGPAPRCLWPVSSGAPGCGTPSRRWYYNAGSGDCVAFVYSGCGGNDNNFRTYDECALCKRVPSPISESDTGNEVLPDCDAYNAECAALHCEYGIQRTRSRSGCERCTCVAPEVNCAQLARDCLNLKCNYGIQKTIDDNGCERCNCIDHPCANKQCASGERCVATPYRDAITRDILYSSDCRLENKSGSCPSYGVSVSSTEGRCRRQCNDDADCPGVGKCCERGCSQLCLEPVAPTSPAPSPTAYVPELPQVPSANSATEPEVHASLGGTATLRCLFHGNPPPKISWQRGQITIEGDVGRYRLLSDGALEIVSLYRNDSGVYICIADNGLGVARQEVNLQVDVPVTTRIVSERTRLAAGTELNLLCEVDGYPVPEVYWTKDLAAISSDDRITATETRLTVSRVNTNDTGVYGCHAFNAYNSHYSSVQISVEGLYIPPTCKDNPYFANCYLIVRSKFCYHKYYSNFCCKSCVEAGQLDVNDLQLQADEALYRK